MLLLSRTANFDRFTLPGTDSPRDLQPSTAVLTTLVYFTGIAGENISTLGIEPVRR